MKVHVCHYTSALAFLLLGNVAFAVADDNPPAKLEVESGTASFESTTNMPGIEVKGKSAALSARVEVTQAGNVFTLRSIDATIPVKSLATGMKVRDEHMRKYIFTTSDGQTPDIHFESSAATCPAPSNGRDLVCRVAGNMTIRGASHAIELTLQAKQQSSGSALAFRVTGEGVVKLSDFGIAAPSQFGVTPANEVKFRLEFAARQKASMAGNSGGRQ
jgi:polyisoprenoid-binding protein YceI